MKKECPKFFELTLVTAKTNQQYIITKIDDTLLFKVKRRIMELGFLVGECVTVLKKSLQGKSCLVSINGCVFSLRKDIAEKICLEKR